VSRVKVDVPTPALALRRAEAAAAVGASVETFDEYVRPHVPCVRLGGVTVYPVAGLTAWLEQHASTMADDLAPRRRNAP
jgi:hypothetical protein